MGPVGITEQTVEKSRLETGPGLEFNS